jgi:phage tail-like protein
VEIQGIPVSGVTRVTGLVRSIAVIEFREGGDPSGQPKPVPGTTTFRPLTLWRPKTLDRAFDDWAAIASMAVAGPADNLLREVVIDLLSAAGQPLLRYRVLNCWPSRYGAFQKLLATSNTSLTERLTLQHQGWVTEVLAV